MYVYGHLPSPGLKEPVTTTSIRKELIISWVTVYGASINTSSTYCLIMYMYVCMLTIINACILYLHTLITNKFHPATCMYECMYVCMCNTHWKK